MSGVVVERAGLVESVHRVHVAVVDSLPVMGVSKQLHSHLRGALNVGALPADVETALAEAEPFLDDEARAAAAALWETVKKGYVG